ncbi:Persistence and stress-resistance toxin PasT [Magnetospirillum gryphiswaldense MSR-1]|uniref:Oligoketide cyclase/lipid transport protein n=1 Tax=Magnetospirillum gryphiswaldense TaxID=55518 RepID=A4TXU6_9PROT|nr:Persistence and stress-resistance toxin PasT [Magnetospirillum gryphiswaldense MSR-1]AVM79596.1 Persistence and stress-resistance toxin PasT [Magnetospirillum gryphiswaldense]CAM75453.1 Oligoketide cyclase/lipid transport protein [Magnetospirillum gryphiswaldense MSR-1]
MALSGRFRVDFPHLTARQLFDIAADIESYPHFIPWCRAARVIRQDGDATMVENHFGAGPVDLRFTTRAVAQAPESLTITGDDGPFTAFRLEWTFADGHVKAQYQIALASPLLQGLAGFAMPEVERRIVSQFRQRANALYGA